ncbi:hypothetical protein PFICI_13405 [Pestalotiopsis fici W106-1]|uniref:Uncharacterized protein n=1 Tax=Pestalotiopsis fici (strain W106-1 / CGMCC3.15140) TaxID=1229662 RepID=W3WQ18_PESFW|nr:uncharacterized protein PFICI_13405 [Pestalotiopsis fici W106-1]ETS74921.1 hypothetical protein PFICI_13405 [Pestalotiopsis fici W106-1]
MQQSDLAQEVFSSSRPSLYSRESNPSLRVVSNRTPSYHSDRARTGSVRHSLLEGGKARLDSSDMPVPPILTRMNSTDTITPMALKKDDHIEHHRASKVRAADIDADQGYYGASKVRPAAMEPPEVPNINKNHHNTLSENQNGYKGASKVRPADIVEQENSLGTPSVRSIMPSFDTRPSRYGRPQYESKVRALSDETILSSDDSILGHGDAHGGHSWVGKVQSFHNASSRPVVSKRLQSIPHLAFSEITEDDSQAEVGQSQATSY